MNWARTKMLESALLVAFASCGSNSQAWAQDASNRVDGPAATALPAAEAGGAGIAAVVIVVGLLVSIGVAVKIFDLRRKRESESLQLQARIADALLRERSLAGLPLVPTVDLPLWDRSPAMIRMNGQVPTPELRELAMRLVRAEVARVRSDVRIEDALSIVPMARAA